MVFWFGRALHLTLRKHPFGVVGGDLALIGLSRFLLFVGRVYEAQFSAEGRVALAFQLAHAPVSMQTDGRVQRPQTRFRRKRKKYISLQIHLFSGKEEGKGR
jgi:hypothetical protein